MRARLESQEGVLVEARLEDGRWLAFELVDEQAGAGRFAVEPWLERAYGNQRARGHDGFVLAALGRTLRFDRAAALALDEALARALGLLGQAPPGPRSRPSPLAGDGVARTVA